MECDVAGAAGEEGKAILQWLRKERIPPGTWPFLNVTRIVLEHFGSSLEDVVDLTEGNDGVTITGCIRA